jgi:AcrR family transcriptional regulator
MQAMARWEPNARGRLEQAAMELYDERGFDRTTVAEIAARADLTERTFFRHFADKREVLFGGGEPLVELLVSTVAAADSAAPLAAVVAALERVGALIQETRGREFARARHRIIAANPELQERELSKLAAWAEALAAALRNRDVGEPAATLASETGIAVFRVAFSRWVGDGDDRDLPALIRDALDLLATLTAADRTSAPRPPGGGRSNRGLHPTSM